MTATVLVIIGLVINFGMLVTGFIALRRKQNEIHVLVNSKLDAALARGVQLADTLKAEGIEVPPAPGNIPSSGRNGDSEPMGDVVPPVTEISQDVG
jgi:hypothetical protein